MSEPIRFVALGRPQTKGSTRSFAHKATGKIVTIGDNPKTKSWQAVVAWSANAAPGVHRAAQPVGVSVGIEFVLSRPKSHYRTGRNAHLLKDSAPCHHVKKPDLDKLTRAVFDGLKGVAYADDSQVSDGRRFKRYARPGEPEGAIITLVYLAAGCGA